MRTSYFTVVLLFPETTKFIENHSNADKWLCRPLPNVRLEVQDWKMKFQTALKLYKLRASTLTDTQNSCSKILKQLSRDQHNTDVLCTLLWTYVSSVLNFISTLPTVTNEPIRTWPGPLYPRRPLSLPRTRILLFPYIQVLQQCTSSSSIHRCNQFLSTHLTSSIAQRWNWKQADMKTLHSNIKFYISTAFPPPVQTSYQATLSGPCWNTIVNFKKPSTMRTPSAGRIPCGRLVNVISRSTSSALSW